MLNSRRLAWIFLIFAAVQSILYFYWNGLIPFDLGGMK